MNRSRASLYAWMLTGFILLLMGMSLFLTLLSRSPSPPAGYVWQARIIWLAGLTSAPIVGGLIAARRPHRLYGWIWLLFSLGFGGIQTLAGSYGIYVMIVAPDTQPFLSEAALVSAYGWFCSMATLPFLLLLFPNSQLLSRRWRIVVYVTLAAAAVVVLTLWAAPTGFGSLDVPNPWALPGLVGEIVTFLRDLGIVIVFFNIFVSALSLFIRLRRAVGVERQQMKWFVFATVLFTAALLRQVLLGELPGLWDIVEESLAFGFLPIAIGIAILRHRLFDIDRIIRRTLLYSVLTTLLALVYFGIIVVLQQLVGVTAGRDSPLIIVFSTLSTAGLFAPLRRYIQTGIDRRFYRRKYDAAHTLSAFAATARDQVDLEQLTGELLQVVQETMQPVSLSLWLQPSTTRVRPVLPPLHSHHS